MVEIEFLYTKEEWIDGRRKFLLQSRTIKKLDIMVLAVMIIINVFSVSHYQFSTFNVILGVFTVLFGALLFLLYVIQPALLYQKGEKYHHPYIIIFNEEDLIFETQGISSVLSWDIYSSYLENSKYFYLMQGKNIYTLIPKRVFASGEDLERFKKLLQAHFVK